MPMASTPPEFPSPLRKFDRAQTTGSMATINDDEAEGKPIVSSKNMYIYIYLFQSICFLL